MRLATGEFRQDIAPAGQFATAGHMTVTGHEDVDPPFHYREAGVDAVVLAFTPDWKRSQADPIP